MTITVKMISLRQTCLILGILTLCTGFSLQPALATDAEHDRLARKIRVMERVFDEVLEQSPNIGVSPGGVSRGLLLEEFGALFTLEGSLGTSVAFGSPLSTWTIAGGNVGLASAYPSLGDEAYREIADDEPSSESSVTKKSLEDWKTENTEKRVEHLAGLKKELTETLVDYGVTLMELDSDSWIAVAAYLDGSSWWGSSNEEQRFLIKVKMGDLRQYHSGAITRDQVMGKVRFEEL